MFAQNFFLILVLGVCFTAAATLLGTNPTIPEPPYVAERSAAELITVAPSVAEARGALR